MSQDKENNTQQSNNERTKLSDLPILQRLQQEYTENIGVVGQEFGTGAIFGVCAGMFSRAAARFAMISFGGFFVALQLLQNSGYINVEWKSIENDITNQLDLNHDGKLDQEDAKIAYERYLKTLTYKLPSTSGFAFAFYLGLRGKFLR